jgi:hypothetical protein
MTWEQFEELRSKQDLTNLHYPSAKEWMWDYCLYLGSFTDSKGRNYDLGVHRNGHDSFRSEFSNATVFDDTPGSYSSGCMDLDVVKNINGKISTMYDWYLEHGFEAIIECWHRLQKINETHNSWS